MITINAALVTAIIGTLIPILVGLVTKFHASSSVKSILSIVLNGIQALIVSSVTSSGDAIISKETILLWVVGVVTSVATYTGVWKPNNVISKLLPNIGIGTNAASEPAQDTPA